MADRDTSHWLEDRMNREMLERMLAPQLWFGLKDELRNVVSVYQQRASSTERLSASFVFDEFRSTVTIGIMPMVPERETARSMSVKLTFDAAAGTVEVKKYHQHPPTEQKVGSLHISLGEDEQATFVMDGKPLGIEMVSKWILEPMLFQRD